MSIPLHLSRLLTLYHFGDLSIPLHLSRLLTLYLFGDWAVYFLISVQENLPQFLKPLSLKLSLARLLSLSLSLSRARATPLLLSSNPLPPPSQTPRLYGQGVCNDGGKVLCETQRLYQVHAPMSSPPSSAPRPPPCLHCANAGESYVGHETRDLFVRGLGAH